MTKLRANSAIKAEVNVWIRHSITFDVVDTFYFKPSMKISCEKLHRKAKNQATPDLADSASGGLQKTIL
ncbi:MAG: hypothetical protein EZS28_000777 [Streblomastix strix]|uniref:Uncharacterized protein n=1 Tax=Streblomastix strix TaxID=222440 RepID=A0A5J4X8V5_9EUKA|nr:MAG: hypothetical protein EZS28_000777 [Streblomastix strix]